MPRKPAVAAESTRPKLERKAKADASERMGGKLEPLRTIHVEPKKTPTPKKTSGKLRKATGYKSMVKRAINENVNRKGTYVSSIFFHFVHLSNSSLASIVNYIAANYDVKDNFRRYLKASLARQVESGLLVKKSPARYALTTKSKAKKATKKATKKAVKKDGEKKVRKTSTKTTSKSDKKKDTPKKLTKKVTKKTTAEKPKKVTVRKTGDTKTSRTKKVAEKALPKKLARGKAALASPRTAGAAETAGSASTDNSTLVWVRFPQFLLTVSRFGNTTTMASSTTTLPAVMSLKEFTKNTSPAPSHAMCEP